MTIHPTSHLIDKHKHMFIDAHKPVVKHAHIHTQGGQPVTTFARESALTYL